MFIEYLQFYYLQFAWHCASMFCDAGEYTDTYICIQRYSYLYKAKFISVYSTAHICTKQNSYLHTAEEQWTCPLAHSSR